MRRPRILIAEDDLFLARAYERTFPGRGLDVQIVGNGIEALREVRKNPPDLLLLDLLMPEMNGLEVLEELHTKHVSFPIVVFTNIAKDSSRRRCLELGVRDYIIKCDVSLEELAERLRSFLPVSKPESPRQQSPGQAKRS